MTLDRSVLATRGAFLHERIASTAGGSQPAADTAELYGVETLAPYGDGWSRPDDETVPSWTATVARLCTAVTDESVAPMDTGEPFEPVVRRMAAWARDELPPAATAALSEQATRDLTVHLIERLATLAGQPLHVDYHTFLAGEPPSGRPSEESASPDELSADSTAQYDAYLTALEDGRIERFFEEFAVLGRLLAERISQWQTNVQLLSERVAADESALADLLGTDTLGPVRGVDPGSGDSHHGGQTVTVVRFDGGTVVYKPRSVAPEAALGSYLDRLTAAMPQLGPLATPEVLDQDGYGWMERVEPEAFETADAVSDYYEQAGVMSWLLSTVRTTDLHYENLIATRESPAVVDAETVLSPDPPGESSQLPDLQVRSHAIYSSPLRSALVPYNTDQTQVDRSGLGMSEPDTESMPSLEWTNLGTDALDVSYEYGQVVPEENVPRLDGEPAPPWLFSEDVLAGFERAQTATMTAREEVAAAMRATLADVDTRIVPRFSITYAATLATLSNPEYLRDGFTHELKLVETLLDQWSNCTFSGADELQRQVVTAERDAMLRRDIPRFATPSDGTAVSVAGEQLGPDVQERAGLAVAQDQLSALSAAEAARQRGMFRASVTNTALGAPVNGGGA